MFSPVLPPLTLPGDVSGKSGSNTGEYLPVAGTSFLFIALIPFLLVLGSPGLIRVLRHACIRKYRPENESKK